MITKKEQIIIVAYLAEKLDLGEDWFENKNKLLFGKSPYECIMSGKGDTLIEWLEERLGLRQPSY